jgi:hypothetical protein
VAGEGRVGVVQVVEPGLPHLVSHRLSAHLVGLQAVNAGAIESEDIAPDRRGQCRVAVPVLELAADFEGAKVEDPILRVAAPDRIGAPEDVVLAEGREQLARQARRLVGVAHHEAPGAAEFGADVLHAVLANRADQHVDAGAGGGAVRPLLDAGVAAGVVDEEGRPEQGVGLEAGELPPRRLRVHAVEFARSRRHAAAVQQQPLGAVKQRGGDAGGAGGGLDQLLVAAFDHQVVMPLDEGAQVGIDIAGAARHGRLPRRLDDGVEVEMGRTALGDEPSRMDRLARTGIAEDRHAQGSPAPGP